MSVTTGVAMTVATIEHAIRVTKNAMTSLFFFIPYHLLLSFSSKNLRKYYEKDKIF